MAHHARVRGSTTVAAGSDGQVLVAATPCTIDVVGALAFPVGGTITVVSSLGVQTVTYTGRTSTTFTGCLGGSGTIHTGNLVVDAWQGVARSELAALDQGIRSGINGVDGGTWAPTSQVVISGSGGGGIATDVPVQVSRGGVLTISGSLGLQCSDGDYPVIDPVWNTAHSSRTVVYPCSAARGAVSSLWMARREFGGSIQAFAPMFDLSDGVGMRPSIARMHLRGHDGAKLTSVTVNFTVAFPHTALPSTMPAARVYALAPNGSFLLLTSQAAGADAFGYVYAPTPSGPTAWFNNGNPQSFTIPIDQNNLLNVGAYDYILELVDEQGLTTWPFGLTVLQPVRVMAASNVLQKGSGSAPVIDGVTLADGDRVLCIRQNSLTEDGVFTVNSRLDVYWKRSLDMSTPQNFRRGFVVPVTSGNTYAGMLLQCDQSILQWSPGVAPATEMWSGAGYSTTAPTVYVIPSTAIKGTGLVYSFPNGSGGSTGGTEPQWPTVSGGTVVDPVNASITWTAIGPDALPTNFLAHPDKAYPVPADGFVGYGTIWHSAVASFAGIADTRPQ
jgi:hypothetical protein